MQPREVLEYLEDLAERLGIEIIYARLGGEDFRVKGGLCKVKGMHKIFIDPSETLEGQTRILTQALSSFNMEGIYLLPKIRELLEKAQRSS